VWEIRKKVINSNGKDGYDRKGRSKEYKLSMPVYVGITHMVATNGSKISSACI
jgi:glucokinase